jgi:hypothetical protein
VLAGRPACALARGMAQKKVGTCTTYHRHAPKREPTFSKSYVSPLSVELSQMDPLKSRARVLALILLSLVTGALEHSPVAAAEASSDRIGTISMAPDGTVTVVYDPSSSNPNPSPPLTLRPGQDAYASYLELAGGLRPGESKPLYRAVGVVEMNEDKSLYVFWSGRTLPGGLVVEPGSETIKPGEPRYDELIRRVGGLTPGHAKILREGV